MHHFYVVLPVLTLSEILPFGTIEPFILLIYAGLKKMHNHLIKCLYVYLPCIDDNGLRPRRHCFHP